VVKSQKIQNLTYLRDHLKNIRKPACKTHLLSGLFYSLKTNIKCRNIVARELHTETKNQLDYYLAGLIEGDGSIILRKGDREKTPPKIVFTFGVKEKPMYQKLQETLNTGAIYEEAGGVCRYSITNADAVINIINRINGKFRTPKIQALYSAIDNLNTWRDANLLKLPLDTSILDTNAWLAGFIDADGHFSIKLTGSYGSDASESRGRVQCVFSRGPPPSGKQWGGGGGAP